MGWGRASAGWRRASAAVGGSGAAGVTLEDEGGTVAGGPHTTLNFVGAGVAVADAGGGEATVTVTSGGGPATELAAGAVALGSVDLSAGQVLIGDGSTVAPGLAFKNDVDTGLARVTAIARLVHSGNSILAIDNGNVSLEASQQLRIQDGTAGAPGLAFASDLDTGLARIASVFDLVFGGAASIEMQAAVAKVASAVQLQIQDGTAGAPGLAFAGDTDTGLARVGGVFGLNYGGSAAIELTTLVTIAAAQLLIGDGSAGAPSLAFLNDTDTGLARISAAFAQVFAGASVSEYVAGVQRMVNASQLQLADGSVGSPALVYVSDPDSGLYYSGTGNDIRIGTGGAARHVSSTTQGDGAPSGIGLRARGPLQFEAESTKTGNYTATNTDAVVVMNGTSLTLTLPPTPATDQILLVKNLNATALTVGRNGNTIDGAAADDTILAGKGQIYVWNGTTWHKMI